MERKKLDVDIDHPAKGDLSVEEIRPAYSTAMRRWR
jgi:ribosomal protein S24E